MQLTSQNQFSFHYYGRYVEERQKNMGTKLLWFPLWAELLLPISEALLKECIESPWNTFATF